MLAATDDATEAPPPGRPPLADQPLREAAAVLAATDDAAGAPPPGRPSLADPPPRGAAGVLAATEDAREFRNICDEYFRIR